MRWRKMEGQRYLNLDKRAYQRDRDRIRRYNKWRGNRCKWIIIVNTMDVWGKRRERVEGREEEEKREEQGIRRGTVGASNVAIGNTGTSAIAGTVNLGIAANTVNIGTVGTIAGGGTKVYIGNTGFGYTTQFNTPITLGPAPSSSTQLGYFPSQPTQQNTTTISTNTAVGTISISSAGTYIVFFNCQIKVPTGGPVFANVTGPPNFTTGNNGFSGLYSSASPYYQSMTGSFFVTTTGSYSYSIVININPSQVSLVTQAYLDYNYIRIA